MLVFHLPVNCTGAGSEDPARHNADAPFHDLLYLINYSGLLGLDKYMLCCSSLLLEIIIFY